MAGTDRQVPGEEDFRALARSSPWLFRTLTFVRRGGGTPAVEARLMRPGHLEVTVEGGRTETVTGPPDGYLTLSAASEGADPGQPERPRLPHEVEPARRADGLVADRPDQVWVDYDDPMYVNYLWVAMLDPVELSHHTQVGEVRAAEVHGRPAWRARVAAAEGYQPRCGCCALLWSWISDRDEAAGGGPPPRPREDYPVAYEVALDRATGVVVSLDPVGGTRDDLAFDVEILDAQLWPKPVH